LTLPPPRAVSYAHVREPRAARLTSQEMRVKRRDSQVESDMEPKNTENPANDAAILALAEAFVAVRAYARALGTCTDEASLDVALMLLARIEESPALYADVRSCSGLRRIAEKLTLWADEVDMREDVRRTLDALQTGQA
jgi:hypothetical protein